MNPPRLTERWSQRLGVPMTSFTFMKQFSILSKHAAASGS
jgi:hypothetical protein